MNDQLNDENSSIDEAFAAAYQLLHQGAPAESEFADRFLEAWEQLDTERETDEGFIEASNRMELSGGGVEAYAGDGGWNVFKLAVEYPDTIDTALEVLGRVADDLEGEADNHATALAMYRGVLAVATPHRETDQQDWQELCQLLHWPDLADEEPDLERIQQRFERMRELEATFQNALNVAKPH